MALSQILILLIGIVSVSYAIGSEVGVVSAVVGNACHDSSGCSTGEFCYIVSAGTGYCTTTENTLPSPPAATTPPSAAPSSPPPSSTAGLSTQISSVLSEISQVGSLASSGSRYLPGGAPARTPVSSPGATSLSGSETTGLPAAATTPYVPPATTNGLPASAYLSGSASGLPAGTATAAAPLTTLFTGQALWGGVWALTIAIGVAAGAAVAVLGVISLIKLWVNAAPGSTWDSILTGAQLAFTAGTFTGVLAAEIFPAGIGTVAAGPLGWIVGGTTAIIVVAAYLIFSQDTKDDAVVIQCVPWQAPYGGSDCSKCGKNGLTCTAYECASLGTACELINAGQNGQPICIATNQNAPQPVITFLGNVLSLSNGNTLNYKPMPAPSYPGDTGVLITPNISPYTILSLGIQTDQAAQCMVSPIRGNSYANMTATGFLIGTDGGINGNEGTWGIRNPDGTYNHTFEIPVFKNQTGTSLSVQQSGQTDYYIRCNNVNNASDTGAYVIQFNADQTPDVTPPSIVSTSPATGTPISFGTFSTDVSVFINKQVTGCRWSHTDQSYQSMPNNMSCRAAPTPLGLFSCIANLTGIVNGATSNFYFRCNDTNGNINQQSYPFVLSGSSSQLSITSASPNQTTITGSTTNIDVTLNLQTSGGYNSGSSTCYYSTNPDESTYMQFSNTTSYQSTQDLWLTPGNYTYYLKCVDFAGDADYSSINFNVQSITTPPNVVRAYHDSGTNTLNIETDRAGNCVYDIVDCTYPFSQGIPLTTLDNITHSTGWVSDQTYYIKCEDQFGNQPQNACSIILNPSSINF